jgi:transcriptional regulator with XRE-family HTH domain
MADAPALLRQARHQAGITQAQLARRLGVSQAAVAKLERPDANPTIATLEQALSMTGHRLTLGSEPVSGLGVDESLIRQQLELSPAQRLRGIEEMYVQGRMLRLAGARSRGERI